MLGAGRIRCVVLIASLLVVCRPVSSAMEQGEIDRRMKIEFDGRDWEVGFTASQRGAHLVEWVLAGENVHCWSELVSWQYFEGWHGHESPKELMRQLRHRRMVRTPSVEWQILSEGFDSVLFTWEIDSDPLIGSYYELTRIIKTHDGLHILHYAARNRRTFSTHLDSWVESFGTFEISR